MVKYLKRYNYIGNKHKNAFHPKQVNTPLGINLMDIF